MTIKLSKLIRWVIILTALAFGMQFLIKALDDKPALVVDVYEQLRVNPDVQKAIGKASGYSFNQYDIERIESLPSKIKLTLIGKKSIALTVLVDSSDQVFEAVSFEIDSLYDD